MSIWADLERAIGRTGLACSQQWVDTWLDHYGDLVPHRFAVGELRGEPIGVVLVTRGVQQRRSRVPVRTVHLGTAGEPRAHSVFVQRNRLLVAAEHREAFAAALLAAVWEEPAWDELVLDGFVPEDAEPLLGAGGFLLRRKPCPTVDLRAADDANGEVARIDLSGATVFRDHREDLENR